MPALTLTPKVIRGSLYPGASTFPGATTYPSGSGLALSAKTTGSLTLTPKS